MAESTIETSGGAESFGRSAPIARALSSVRAAARRRLIVERVAALLAVIVAMVIAAAVVDFAFRLPMVLRIAAWAFGVFTLFGTAARVLAPVFRFSPSLVEVALRVERSSVGHEAGLEGRLASGLELGRTGSPGEFGAELASQAVAETLERFAKVKAGAALLTSAKAQRGLASLAAALFPLMVAFWGIPEYAKLGIVRVVLPWVDVSWPKRTMLQADVAVGAHPIDEPLTLRAVVTRTNQEAGRTSVTAVYRVAVGDRKGPETRVLLNPPRKPGTPRSAGEADAYEAVVPKEQLAASLPAGGESVAQDGSRTLEIRFETADDETEATPVILVERPRLLAAKATVSPPEYAMGVPAVVAGESELSVDHAKPASVGPVLAGSTIELVLNLNKPLPVPGEKAFYVAEGQSGPDRATWLARTFGKTASGDAAAIPDGAEIELSPDRWVMRWTAAPSLSTGQGGTIKLNLTDRFGIMSAEEASFAFAVVPDASPTAVVVDPPTDEAVLATAVIPVAGQGRDDVGLRKVSLEGQRQSPQPGSSGAAPEPVGAAAELGTAEMKTPGEVLAKVTAELDLSKYGVQPGDEFWLSAVAQDRYVLGMAVHEAVRSAPRKLRIISEAQLVEQIMAELAPLRSAAERLDQDQATLSKRTDELAKAAADRSQAATETQQQKSIAERLTPAGELVKRAKDRVERNAVADQSLKGMLDQAQQLVEKAAEAAQQASEAVKEVGQTPQGQAADQKAADQAKAQQAKVRDNLEKLADLVAQGQDGWATRQAVERLLNDQRALTEQSSQAGERAAGASKEQLPQDVQQELDRLARQQQDLSRRAEQAVQNLGERAQKSKQSDPAQSAGLDRAAKKAQQDQLREKMQEAAKALQQNQTGKANQAQKSSEQTLEEVLKEIDGAQKRKDEALKRVLEQLVESIDALIAEQQKQLSALAKATTSGAYEGLTQPLATLRSNTLGVADNVEIREVEEIVQRLTAAADHQDTAGANLKPPADAIVADENERMSLKRLNEAKELAQTMQQEAQKRDEGRKRSEMLQAYRKAMDAQVKVTEDTKPYVGKEISRKDRAAVRGLGARQAEVKEQLAKVREANPEISQADVIDYVHTEIDRAITKAGAKLSDGEATAAVGRDQAEAVELFKSLVTALADSAKKAQDPFRKNEDNGGGGQSGGGGQQQQGLIPPVIQLQVLKSIQQRLAGQTRAAAEGGNPDPALVDEIGIKQREFAERAQKVADSLKNGPGGQKPPAKPEGGGR